NVRPSRAKVTPQKLKSDALNAFPSRAIATSSRLSMAIAFAWRSNTRVDVENPCSAYEWPFSNSVVAANRPSGEIRTRLGTPNSGNRCPGSNRLSKATAQRRTGRSLAVASARHNPRPPAKYTRSQTRGVTYAGPAGFDSGASSTCLKESLAETSTNIRYGRAGTDGRCVVDRVGGLGREHAAASTRHMTPTACRVIFIEAACGERPEPGRRCRPCC